MSIWLDNTSNRSTIAAVGAACMKIRNQYEIQRLKFQFKIYYRMR